MKIPTRKHDIIIEIACLFCLIGGLLYLITGWGQIPNEIPGHYNALGQIDKITGKGSLLALLATNWILYIGLSIVERFPSIWNTGVTVTKENKDRVYRVVKDLLKTMKLLVVVMFTYLLINSAKAVPLSPWFLPITMILTFGFLFFFIWKLFKIK
ncbi:MAG: DUF1648 domain-containing protein [Anaerovoracaceae bacterium]